MDGSSASLFKSVIMDVYSNDYHSTAGERKRHIGRITALNNKITKARELLLNEEIEPADFRAAKMEAEKEINILESKISDLQVSRMSASEVEKTIYFALVSLTDLKNLYSNSDHFARRKLIGSIP